MRQVYLTIVLGLTMAVDAAAQQTPSTTRSAPATTPQPGTAPGGPPSVPKLTPVPPSTVPDVDVAPGSGAAAKPGHLPEKPQQLQVEDITAPAEDELPGTTLDELEFIAQTQNPALREASARVGAAQGNALQVGLYPNPFFFVSTPQLAGSISQYNAVWGQDFVTAGKLRLNRAAAMREVQQAQLNFTRARFDVLTNVRVQFYTTAASQRRTEVLEQLTHVTARSRDVGQKLLQAGEMNRADSTLLEIENDRAIVGLKNNQATFLAARRQLSAVVGTPDYEIGRLKFDLAAPLPQYEHEALRLGVVNQNALASVAAVEIARTQAVLRRARVEPYPNFQVQGGFQYGVEAPRHDQGYGQFTMTVPVWNRNQGAIRQAQADTVRASAGLQRVENELSQQAAAALGEYASADVRAAIYHENILPKARDVFQVNRSLFEQGQTDFLRLLQAQRTLIEADLGYIDAQEARWIAAARIAGLLQVPEFP
jgi:cobalt-zinc-cadmium efflux system outer membrane protein